MLKSHSFSGNLYPQNRAKAKASLLSRIPPRPRSQYADFNGGEEIDPTTVRSGEIVRPGHPGRTQMQLSWMRLGDSSVPRPPGTQASAPLQGSPGGVTNPSRELWKQTILLRSSPLCRLLSVPWNSAAFLELSATVLLWLLLLMDCIIF